VEDLPQAKGFKNHFGTAVAKVASQSRINAMQAKSKVKGLLRRFLSSTPDQARDTGLAMVLICLLLAYWGGRPQLILGAIALLLLTMVWPQIFRPLAGLWFGLSHLIGTIASKIILTALFFFLVTPVGLIRRFWGADPLQLKKWKNGSNSVFILRDGTTRPQDLVNPY
jgi:hypothetical protein